MIYLNMFSFEMYCFVCNYYNLNMMLCKQNRNNTLQNRKINDEQYDIENHDKTIYNL